MLHSDSSPSREPDGVFPGAVILTCGLLSILVVSHHPVLHAHSPGQVLGGITALGPANEIVHGILITFMLALTFGFSVFAWRQGLYRLTSLAGLISYSAGALVLCGAALIDGFFAPMFALQNGSASGANLTSVFAVFAAGAVMIQVLTKFGFIAMSLGICLWSTGLARAPGMQRYVAIAGAIAVFAPVAVMIVKHAIDPQALTIIVLCQAVWYVAVGTLMVRRVI